MSHHSINIGLFGFGVAGEGLYRVLQDAPVPGISIKKICIKNAGKPRNAPPELFTTNKEDILTDRVINVVVEVTNDAHAAFHITSAALCAGKHVVSANKKMIAAHFTELLQLQRECGRSFLYESSVCAAIPVIRNLEEYYRHSPLSSVRAIVNGSCNYILTKISSGKHSYPDALKQAQQQGFAESDPAQDVDGWDAAAKLQILLAHACGIVTTQKEVLFGGIRNIHEADIQIAQQHGWQIKQVAQVKKINEEEYTAWSLPQFVHEEDPLYRVKNEYNGIVIENNFEEKQFFHGRGAGGFPTATALLNDISSLKEDYHYSYPKIGQHRLSSNALLRVYCNFHRRKQVPEHLFESIQEWQMEGERQFITGTIHQQTLAENNWWRHRDVSLIVLPESSDEKIRVLKKTKEKYSEVHC